MNDTPKTEQLEEALKQLPRFGKPLPKEPTRAVPGSEEKIQVLAERVARGEQLYHPQDATYEKPKDAEVEPYPFVKANRSGKRRKQQKLGYNKFSTELLADE